MVKENKFVKRKNLKMKNKICKGNKNEKIKKNNVSFKTNGK